MSTGASAAFDLLEDGVKRWIWRQGWEELKDIQERSIPILLEGRRDLIVSAGTASGKTEAAFLPIVSALRTREDPEDGGFGALYVSPMRALINDQFGRMESLCADVGVAVVKWHGDVAASVKAKARRSPSGIVLITPESLEALLVRRGGEARRLFGALRHVVIDEMHAFMDVARGRQLQSVMHRIEVAAGRRIPRVGLSATLADEMSSKTFLRPLDPEGVTVLASTSGGQDLQLQLRGHLQPVGTGSRKPAAPEDDGDDPLADEATARAQIAEHVYATLRGRRGLVFAGSRGSVEEMAAALSSRCERDGVPDEFFAHHGSLSREHREDAERRLKAEDRPGSIVSTTTLELGIDIGHIEAVAQIGPGQTVSGMRQRLGRSGRRAGHPSVMRIYVTETELDGRTALIDSLRASTVQAIAMVELMLRRWNEPPCAGRLDLSTFVHQVLALIAQHGGVRLPDLHSWLVAAGTFPDVDRELFLEVLRRMKDPVVGLLEQAADGTLLAGAVGEGIIESRDFYTVFMTQEEMRIVTDRGKSLGTMPTGAEVLPGQAIIFAGRRWRVVEVKTERRTIVVTKARGGKPPRFGGARKAPDEAIVLEMKRIWEGAGTPRYLDPRAAALLAEGRAGFAEAELGERSAHRDERGATLFPWTGPRRQTALVLALNAKGVKATADGIAVSVPGADCARLRPALAAIATGGPIEAVDLVADVPDLERAKFDAFLGPVLLARCYASEHVDATGLSELAAALLARMPPGERDVGDEDDA